MQRLENETKLRVPTRFDLRRLQPGTNGFQLTPVEPHRLSTVYYDSDDLRLMRWGCSLRYRRGDGWTLKLPRASKNSGLNRNEHIFPDEGAKVPSEALDLTTAFLRGKPVSPVARLRTLRKSTKVLSQDGAEVAEIVDDDVRVMESGHVAKRFREVEIELHESAPHPLLDELVGWLQTMGAGDVDNTPKSVRALGDGSLQPEIPAIRADARSSASALVQQALAASVERLVRQDPLVRASTTPEAVHQARVATRRLRSDLRTFLPLLQHDWACGLRGRLRWLADELGSVRDSDVLVQGLCQYAGRLSASEHAGTHRVIEHFTDKSEQARTQLLAAMREPRYVRLLEELVDAAEHPRFLPKADVPAASVLAELMRNPWKKLCEAIDGIGKDASFEQLHQARIKAKRCRYACEAIEPAAGKKAHKLAKRVEALQKVLGEFHDAVVMQQQLREYGGEGHDLFVAGTMSGLAAVDAQKARSSWPKVWEKAAKKKLRFWL